MGALRILGSHFKNLYQNGPVSFKFVGQMDAAIYRSMLQLAARLHILNSKSCSFLPANALRATLHLRALGFSVYSLVVQYHVTANWYLHATWAAALLPELLQLWWARRKKLSRRRGMSWNVHECPGEDLYALRLLRDEYRGRGETQIHFRKRLNGNPLALWEAMIDPWQGSQPDLWVEIIHRFGI